MPPPLPPLDGFGAGRAARDSAELPAHADEPGLYAGFWRRVAAYMIDFVVLVLLAFALGLALGILEGIVFKHATDGFNQFVGVIVAWLYFALQESSEAQATLGKRAVGFRVTDLRGGRIGFGRATGRYFGKYISAILFCVGFMMAGWTRRKQGLHDMLAGTLVVTNDGLQNFEAGENGASRRPVQRIQGWVIALIAVGGGVFLISAILGAAGFAGYRDYMVRTQVVEGLTLAEPAKTALREYYINNHGQWPGSNADAGLSQPDALAGKYVSSIDVGVRPGEIVVTYADDAPAVSREIRGKRLVLAGEATSDGLIIWHCDRSLTTIPDRDLPMACRRRAATD